MGARCSKLKKNRGSINESITQESEYNLIEQNKETTKLTKSEKAIIIASLHKTSIFADLNEYDFQQFFKAFKTYFVPAGQFIFHQGSFGTEFFIVQSGSVEVLVGNKRKGILYKEDCFGELALLSDSTRKASIRTLQKSSFWVLSQESFLQVVKSIRIRNFDRILGKLVKIKLFSGLSESSVESLALSAIVQKFRDKEVIIKEGDNGQFMYILLEGVVKFFKNGQEIAKIKEEGEVFGENAILTGNPRIASCVSHGCSELVSLDKKVVETVLGKDFKSVILRCIAKLAIKNESNLNFLSKVHIDRITENLVFKEFKKDDVVFLPGTVKNGICIVCVGDVVSSENVLRPYDIVGINNLLLKKLDSFLYTAKSHTILAELDSESLKNVTGIEVSALNTSLETLNFLRNITLFKQFSLESLTKIAKSAVKSQYNKKQLIFTTGDQSESLFIVLSGTIHIISSEQIVRILSKKEYFGERTFKESKRSASAISNSASELLQIPKAVLLNLPERKYMNQEIERKFLHQNDVDFKNMTVLFKYSQPWGSRVHLKVKHNGKKKGIYTLVLVPHSSLKSKKDCENLVHERQIQVLLDHHLIQKLVKATRNDSYILFFTEHIPGALLKNFLPVSEKYAKILIIFLCSLLDYLHNKNIIYRDLNPENILINPKGLPHLFNFKHSKIVEQRTYTKIGNYFYMAPEMILARGYSKSVDFWALGVILHEMIYGTLPFGIEPDDTAPVAFMKIIKNNNWKAEGKFEAANQVIGQLLTVANQRHGSDEVRNSSWMGSLDLDQILMSDEVENRPCVGNEKGSKLVIFLERFIEVTNI